MRIGKPDELFELCLSFGKLMGFSIRVTWTEHEVGWHVEVWFDDGLSLVDQTESGVSSMNLFMAVPRKVP